MQVRLGMLKADDVPSLQQAPAPPVVQGAIMLGKGAQLPLLVPTVVSAQHLPTYLATSSQLRSFPRCWNRLRQSLELRS